MAKYNPVYATIDEALKRCEPLTTDASYAKCVKRYGQGDRFALPPQTVNVGAKFVGRGTPLNTEDIIGGTIEGNGLRTGSRLCVPSEKKNPLTCRVELDFPSPEDEATKGLPPGTPAVIRKCEVKGKDGPLVPVRTIDEALHVSTEFCNCVGSRPTDGKRKKCARKAA